MPIFTYRLNWIGGNFADAYPLVDFFHARGWLYPGSKVFPYVAPLLPHTSACSSVVRTALDNDVINAFQMEFRRNLSKNCDLREFVSMNYYPRTVRLLCGAVASRSMLFGPDGRLYKCVSKTWGRPPMGRPFVLLFSDCPQNVSLAMI